MFRRRKKHESDEVEQSDQVADGNDADPGEAADLLETEPDGADSPLPLVRPTGPWDEQDAPEDGVNRVDLGALLVPVPPDTEVRVDVNPEGAVVAATLVRGASSMQVNVFAAPRSYGIWAEVRAEIGTALRAGGGQAQDVPGALGVELHAMVPTQVPGAGVALAPARFIGVDGPRWFLRALLTGPAAADAAQAVELEEALRQIVVIRGTEAMAVRDALPLRLPKEVVAQAPGLVQAGGPDPDPTEAEPPSLELPVRGPEITERR